MKRPQTWQDDEGLHLVMPNAGRNVAGSYANGVKVRQVADSVEVIIPVKPGTGVSVKPGANRLDVVVDGRLREKKQGDKDDVGVDVSSGRDFATSSQNRDEIRGEISSQRAQIPLNPSIGSELTATAPIAPGTTLPARPIQQTPPAPGETSSVLQSGQDDGEGMFAMIPSPLVLVALLGLGIGALVVVRQRKRSEDDGPEKVEEVPVGKGKALERKASARQVFERRQADRRADLGRRGTDLTTGLDRAAQLTASRNAVNSGTGPLGRSQNGGMPELFGAYRVDQEVGKLVIGQPHRMDVLGSRAPDDRRAIEASLLKYINSPEADAAGLRRARTALEEYGFVARQSAALLLANSSFERSAAARSLGEIGSVAALPFLLEALYDHEEIVRIQAVSGLGALRLPSAIGALLDMARHHPEMPSDVISRALSACSVDCFDIGVSVPIDGELLALGDGSSFTGEITQLDRPDDIEELPENSDDPKFFGLLDAVRHSHGEEQVEAARSLGDYRVKSALEALSEIAGGEHDSGLRAATITALGAIDHSSAFVPIITALADEAREVRAAAARALSGLSIDRADAYARVFQEADEATIREVARASIKSGIARQAIERLGSTDRRQAYEAFATLVVMASANETGMLLEAIAHSDESVAIAATRVLGAAGRPEVLPGLRQAAVKDSMSENVRTAVLEVIYKIDQNQPV